MADSGSVGGAERVGGWFDTLRHAFANRPDTEHEVALWRIAFLAVLLAGFLFQGKDMLGGLLRAPVILTFLSLMGAIGLLLHIFREPEVSPLRRYASIGLDQIYVSAMVALLGEMGAWFLPIYLMTSVGNSLRFGRRYGYIAGLVGAVGFYAAYHLDQSRFWAGQPTIVGAILVTMLIVPAYVAVLGHRLETLSQRYRARAKKLRKVATQDALTGLANRAYFHRLLERAMALARVTDASGEGFAILYCDLDGFKSVNDSHGHHVGDLLLQAVGRTLSGCVRGSDVVARLGGDEFAILLKGIRDAEIARRIGNNIVLRVKAIDRVDGIPITISCSVGITLVAAPLDEYDSLENIMSRADEAMYQAKRAGKNQFYLQWANA